MRGVSSLQKKWLDEQPDDDIAVFVVWSDQLGAKPEHVPDAAALMPDPRARHYWDEHKVLGRAYQELDLDGELLTLGIEAWDVWLLFDGAAEWGDTGLPKPSWWEHQLDGLPSERRLDAERLAGKVAELRRRPGG